MQEVLASVQKITELVLQTQQGYQALQQHLNDLRDCHNEMHKVIRQQVNEIAINFEESFNQLEGQICGIQQERAIQEEQYAVTVEEKMQDPTDSNYCQEERAQKDKIVGPSIQSKASNSSAPESTQSTHLHRELIHLSIGTLSTSDTRGRIPSKGPRLVWHPPWKTYGFISSCLAMGETLLPPTGVEILSPTCIFRLAPSRTSFSPSLIAVNLALPLFLSFISSLPQVFLCFHLLSMGLDFQKIISVMSARMVFDKMPNKSGVGYGTSLLSGFDQSGQSQGILLFYVMMDQRNLQLETNTRLTKATEAGLDLECNSATNTKIDNAAEVGTINKNSLQECNPDFIGPRSISFSCVLWFWCLQGVLSMAGLPKRHQFADAFAKLTPFSNPRTRPLHTSHAKLYQSRDEVYEVLSTLLVIYGGGKIFLGLQVLGEKKCAPQLLDFLPLKVIFKPFDRGREITSVEMDCDGQDAIKILLNPSYEVQVASPCDYLAFTPLLPDITYSTKCHFAIVGGGPTSLEFPTESQGEFVSVHLKNMGSDEHSLRAFAFFENGDNGISKGSIGAHYFSSPYY